MWPNIAQLQVSFCSPQSCTCASAQPGSELISNKLNSKISSNRSLTNRVMIELRRVKKPTTINPLAFNLFLSCGYKHYCSALQPSRKCWYYRVPPTCYLRFAHEHRKPGLRVCTLLLSAEYKVLLLPAPLFSCALTSWANSVTDCQAVWLATAVKPLTGGNNTSSR